MTSQLEQPFASNFFGTTDQKAVFSVPELQQELTKSLPIHHYTKETFLHPEVQEALASMVELRKATDFTTRTSNGEHEFICRRISRTVCFVIVAKGLKNSRELSPGKYGQDIDHLFLFDARTGFITDLKHFWSKQPLFENKNQPVIITGQNHTQDGGPGALIRMKQPIIYLPYLRGVDGRDFYQTEESLRALTVPHELGHFLQINESTYRAFTGTFDQVMETSSRRIKILAILLLNSIIPFGKRYEKVRAIKQDFILAERNAHAFALNLFRHLSKQGIDLSDQFPLMIKGVNDALSTYDKFLKIIPGGTFRKAKEISLPKPKSSFYIET